ncbi:MAG: PilW family protein, partial [Gammaproteobacteria bacterium]
VAMTIGLVLAGAGIAVYSNSRAAYTVNESVSRLQENARYALDEITRDLRLAGYWGLNSNAGLVEKRSGQWGAPAAAINDCAPQWYIDLSNRVEGTDGDRTGYEDCIPAATYQPGTDILAMRFVDPTPVMALLGNTAYIRSNGNKAELFLGTAQPGGFGTTPPPQNVKLESRAYYVSPWTNTAGDEAPALKRVVLVPGAGNVALQGEVVVSGVENLQVQYGLNVDDNPDIGDGSLNRYVNNGGGLWSQVEAVRVWILVRAPTAEVGYTNTTSYQFPQGPPFVPNDGFRRMLVTRTIQLHN